MRRVFLSAVCLFIIAPVYSEDAAVSEPEAHPEPYIEEAPPQKRHFLPALGETILSNGLLLLNNRFILHKDYAYISPDSIRNNFATGFVWDSDEYFVNQFGHPYQGSTYHAAARSNGFGFYEAMLFDAFGSITWELLAETEPPSTNDLLCTILGGASLGEMLHRLYFEIPGPFAILVSPVDAFNGLVTGRRPKRQTQNIYRWTVAAGAAYTYARRTEFLEGGESLVLGKNHAGSIDVSTNVVYGDPFEQQSNIPYNHFELTLYGNIGLPPWYNIKILSDGYLFSFAALDKEDEKASTGLTLHYDLFADRHIDFFSEALDWTFKYKKDFRSDTHLELKIHIGWTIFNANTFHSQTKYAGLNDIENNYGTGTNMKFAVIYEHPQWGKFDMHTDVFFVYSVFQNRDNDTGGNLGLFIDASYSHPIGKIFSMGIGGSMLRENSYNGNVQNYVKWTNIARVYTEWRLK